MSSVWLCVCVCVCECFLLANWKFSVIMNKDCQPPSCRCMCVSVSVCIYAPVCVSVCARVPMCVCVFVRVEGLADADVVLLLCQSCRPSGETKEPHEKYMIIILPQCTQKPNWKSPPSPICVQIGMEGHGQVCVC